MVLAGETDVAGWREKARALLRAGVPPEQATWSTAAAADDLFAALPEDERAAAADAPAAFAPPVAEPDRRCRGGFLALADDVILHSDPARFGVLYALLWRLTNGEPRLLAVAADPLLRRAEAMAASVRRDIHKMKAFVRFRPVADADGEVHIAWFEPAHHIVEAAAPFFVRRFTSMRWSIPDAAPLRLLGWRAAGLRARRRRRQACPRRCHG
ncbi:MAG: TIGR03915 family putative DNA repair protein [Rhodospirillales bacterium]